MLKRLFKSRPVRKAVLCFLIVAAGGLGIMAITTDPILDTSSILHQHNKQKEDVTEKILTKWVFEKSDRISFQIAQTIVREAMKTDKPLLMLALIEVESNFVPSAVSSKGAMGLTQVMPFVHSKVLIEAKIIKEKRDLFDIGPSIQAGNVILSDYLRQSNGDVPKALERYLGGKDGAYVHRILANLANLYARM